MGIAFNANEIFDIAVLIERNGAKFYYQAINSAADSSVRDLLKRLGAMEERHEKVFVEMKERLTDEDRTMATFDPEGQGGAYLRALANSRVFDLRTDPTTKLTGKEQAGSILSLAIELEKDAIIFYLGMKEMVPAGLGRDKIDEIIREEMRHITELSNELSRLS